MIVDLSKINIFGLHGIDVLVILAFVFSFVITMHTLPKVMRKMKIAGFVGVDIHKKNKPEIPQMGGIAALYGFSLGLAVILGVQSMFNWGDHRVVMLAAVGVFLVAAFVGLIDDISVLSTRSKILYIALASIPLIAVAPSQAIFTMPFYGTMYFMDPYILYIIFWIIIIPIGITGVANALNMSSGCNGLCSGEICVISFFLMIISYLKNPHNGSTLIFAALFGATLVLYHYNKFPARTFIGNAGALGLGAAIGAGLIIGKIEFYGIICIMPAFYELFATVYYGAKGVKRKSLCKNPIILDDGRIKPPKGAEKYTLRYYILSKKPMTEKQVVDVILSSYILCSAVALGLSMVG